MKCEGTKLNDSAGLKGAGLECRRKLTILVFTDVTLLLAQQKTVNR